MSAQGVKSVAVIGGGVAGLNAALDLADQGFHVDLIEKNSQLGGMISNLHRLYPICSCCKVLNRTIACSQHPLISVWTSTTVEKVEGSVPSFKITLNSEGSAKTLEANAIVLAAGLEPFDPSVYDTYAYSKFPNVITSTELEWMQKPISGSQGVVTRPSDGKIPKKVAWLQCVGSRELNKCDAPYCSSVCCMYALKEASHIKDSSPETETTIFFMDIRTHGKGYEEYLNNALAKGVKLVRSRIHSIEKAPGTEDLVLEYLDEKGEKQAEIFDLVVLSVGLRPSQGVKEVAEKLGVKVNKYGFIETSELNPGSTNIEGIFACGAAVGPRDVHQSVIEAQAVAAKVSKLIGGNGASPKNVAFRDVSTEEPKVGVVFSLCPGRSTSLNETVENLTSYVKTLSGVTVANRIDLQNAEAFKELAEWIKKTGINRLVYASCSPIMHREMIEWAMKEAQLNPTLYSFVDLRTIGTSEKEIKQLKDLLRASVLHARMSEPLPIKSVPIEQSALVIGGGIAGMTAALALADRGIEVTLVEKKEQLGGHGHKVKSTWNGISVQELLKDLISKVSRNPKIKVLLNSTVVDAKGFGGQFESIISTKGSLQTVRHGAVIITTGAHSLKPAEYGYGAHPEIYRWSDLTKKIIDSPEKFKNVNSAVFIQCVGSREPQRPYCSRLCCSFTARTACDLKAINPEMDIYVLYRDIRTFGEREEVYKEAREKGVLFIRYDLDRKPSVKIENSKMKVQVYDPVLEREIILEPDFISLQTAIYPEPVEELARLYKASVDCYGFLKESPAKMKPVDGEMEGVFFAGLALGPKGVEESIEEAWAAAGRALRFLAQGTIFVGGAVAEVNPDRCAVCLTCVRTCPYGIPVIQSVQEAAYIDPALCRGCGMCVSECPGKAIMFRKLSDDHIIAMAEALVKEA